MHGSRGLQQRQQQHVHAGRAVERFDLGDTVDSASGWVSGVERRLVHLGHRMYGSRELHQRQHRAKCQRGRAVERFDLGYTVHPEYSWASDLEGCVLYLGPEMYGGGDPVRRHSATAAGRAILLNCQSSSPGGQSGCIEIDSVHRAWEDLHMAGPQLVSGVAGRSGTCRHLQTVEGHYPYSGSSPSSSRVCAVVLVCGKG